VVVSVVVNIDKGSRFTIEERVEMLREVIEDLDNVRVDSFSGLARGLLPERKLRGGGQGAAHGRRLRG
jgi:phosphopantetheine adenylyltransferase